MAEVGRVLWRPPGTTPLLNQGHPEQVHRTMSRQLLGPRTNKLSEQPVPVLATCTVKVFWIFRQTSCLPVCDHGLLTYHREPLKRAWFCLVCTKYLQIFIHLDKTVLSLLLRVFISLWRMRYETHWCY